MNVQKAVFFIALSLFGCESKPKPVPIEYGKDACYWCKMTITGPRFGGEIVTKKGRVYKFDDVSCMINFFWNTSDIKEKDVALFLVKDYAHPDSFINALKSVYVQSDNVHSPMGSDIAAFKSLDDAEAFLKKNGGGVLNWTQVMDIVRKQMPGR